MDENNKVDFEEILKNNLYLAKYIDSIKNKLGLPNFYVSLNKELRNIKNPNIIYPVIDSIFIHIYKDEKSNEIFYKVIIEPLSPRLKKIYEKILQKIIAIAYLSQIPKNENEVKEILLVLFEKIVDIKPKKNFFNFEEKIYLERHEYDLVKFYLIMNRIGYGKIHPLLNDIYIEDISCIGVGKIWIVHKIFSSIKTSLEFIDDLELNTYISNIAQRVDKSISESNPVLDSVMPDGSRLNVIYSKSISLSGSSFTIRRHSDSVINILSLCKWGTLSTEMAAYMWLCLENDMSLFICGETASGKTTTLNALTILIPYNKKIYSVEQTPELEVEHKNWQHLITKENREKSDVTMFDLLIASLRSRPEYIIIGEIRGKEANITFQAIQTGHPCISTFHAGSIHTMVQRLIGDPINIPITFIDNLNIVLIQSPVYIKKKIERRVISITEIIKYEDKVGKISSKEVFTWNNLSDKHLFKGLYNSHILENKIALKLNLKNKREIYEILAERKKILDSFLKIEIKENKDLFHLFKKYKNEGLIGLREENITI